MEKSVEKIKPVERIKPFYVFSVDGSFYLLKLISNRFFSISSEEYRILAEFPVRGANPEGQVFGDGGPFWDVAAKYDLTGDGKPYDDLRHVRWNNIYEGRKINCIELMISQECNMRCEYCYGDSNFGGRGFMTFETAKTAIDAFLSSAGDDPTVSFFGGEPLLNFSLIRQVMEYIRFTLNRDDVTYKITTNGALITDEMISFFREYTVDLSVSFDGRMQHKYRHFANGSDSYDAVSENIKKVLAVYPGLIGRGTLYGEGNAEEMSEDLRRAGFYKGYVSGASGCLPKGVVLKEKQIRYRELMKRYPEITRNFLEAVRKKDTETIRAITFDEEYMEAVGYGYHPSPVMMSCGCGRTLFAVDTKGDIYPCHRFVGTDEMKLGNISNGIEQSGSEQSGSEQIDSEETGFGQTGKSVFAEHITFENPECKNCFLRFSCGGSCMHENYSDASADREEPSIHVPFPEFCAFRRLSAELAIHLFLSLTREERLWLRDLLKDEYKTVKGGRLKNC